MSLGSNYIKVNIDPKYKDEIDKKKELVFTKNRTTTGLVEFTSVSNGNKVYSTMLGEQGLLDLLETELHSAEIQKDDWNGVIEEVNKKVNLTTFDATMADIANVIVATGTANAITLTLQGLTSYRTNMLVTFIASADNNGTATTLDINGLGVKNLYKPNTTDAPTLKSGKATTVWYDGTSFFLKASAEGDAVVANVLAGKTFSNDDDTGLVGTMDLTNLIPENVRKDIDINGIIGTLDGKKWATGTMLSTGTTLNITGLTFTPSLFLVYQTTSNVDLNSLVIVGTISGNMYERDGNYNQVYCIEFSNNARVITGKTAVFGIDYINDVYTNSSGVDIKWYAFE